MATRRITYGELENGMQVWLQGVLFTATEVEKRPTVPGMHETLRPEDHTRVTFKGIVVNDKSLKNTAYDGGSYGGYSWVLITIEEQPVPEPEPNAPTAEQLASVQEWAKQHGRAWKADLRTAWMSGNYHGFQGSSLLQQLRNTFGPSWLAAFRLPVESPEPAPLDPKRLAWIESILSNDESSTDYELGLFFIAHAVPEETAQAYIAHRTDYLNSL